MIGSAVMRAGVHRGQHAARLSQWLLSVDTQRTTPGIKEAMS
jgi:hypothetical protein